MKLLIMASEIPDARTVADVAATSDTEVYLVAPALEDSPLRFWVSDVDDAIAKARDVRDRALSDLRDSGVSASGDVGEAEPLTAAEDALAQFPADRVLILVHEGDEQAYQEEEMEEIRERLGVPVELRRVDRVG